MSDTTRYGDAVTRVMKPLSAEAACLLGALRKHECYRNDKALTDARLAEICHVPERTVIDLAGELLDHGYLVVARVTPPYGRYLVLPGDDLSAARNYAEQLVGRVKGAAARARKVRACIRRYEQQMFPADDRGQGNLFSGGGPVPSGTACFTR